METKPSTLILSILFPEMANCRLIRVGSLSIDRGDHAARYPTLRAADRELQDESGRTSSPANLFWAISETLYPSRLLSFPTKPSLCLASPKRWVLATPKTLKTEVIREQRSKTQRHRSAVGQRSDSG